MNRKSSLLKSGISLSVLTLVSRVLGLIREMTKSAFLGTGPLADAFTVAFMIPNLLRRIFAENSMTVAFIPTFQTYLEEEKRNTPDAKASMKEFLSATFTMLSFAVTGTVIIGILCSGLIVAVFFPKIGDFSATVLLTRIMFPYLLLISVAAFFQGILNGVRSFLPTGITPILFNLSVIGCTFVLAKPCGNPALAMAIGVVIGGSCQMLFQLPFVLRAGFSFKLIPFRRCVQNTAADCADLDRYGGVSNQRPRFHGACDIFRSWGCGKFAVFNPVTRTYSRHLRRFRRHGYLARPFRPCG